MRWQWGEGAYSIITAARSIRKAGRKKVGWGEDAESQARPGWAGLDRERELRESKTDYLL